MLRDKAGRKEQLKATECSHDSRGFSFWEDASCWDSPCPKRSFHIRVNTGVYEWDSKCSEALIDWGAGICYWGDGSSLEPPGTGFDPQCPKWGKKGTATMVQITPNSARGELPEAQFSRKGRDNFSPKAPHQDFNCFSLSTGGKGQWLGTSSQCAQGCSGPETGWHGCN